MNNYSEEKHEATEDVILPDVIIQLEEEGKEYREFFKNAACLRGRVSKVNGRIGQGKHSKVYWGVQYETGKHIIIKVDTRRPVQDREAIMRKINGLRHLRHPDIMGLVDFIPDDEHERSYIIMEYTGGKNLRDALREEGPFSQRTVLDWACQILRVLKYLHDKGHIHGDVRLSSIVRRDKDNSVCLCDFSYLIDEGYVAPESESNNPDESDNSVRDVFGVLKDKEQLRIEQNLDLHYLGFALYQLLTKKTPRKDQTPEQMKKELLSSVRPGEGHLGISEGVADIIVKALSKKPEERFQSADEMLAAFHELPLRDPSIKRNRRQAVFAAWTLSFLMIIGMLISWVGQYQIDRLAYMSQKAAESQSAMREADYTKALTLAMDATRRTLLDPNPAFASGAQAALTEALGVYNLSSGYKPLHSNANLRGKPLKVRLSPDGSFVAVLVEDTSAVPSVKRIQILETESGRDVGASLIANPSAYSDFEFADNETLLYAGENGFSACKFLLSEFASDVDNKGTEIALSGDRAVAAVIRPEDAERKTASSSVSFYRTDNLTPMTLTFQGKKIRQTSNVADYDTEGNLFALDGTGRFLAVSFADGGLRLYQLDAPGKPGDGKNYCDIFTASEYTRFEGGFYGSYFFYAATKEQSSGAQSEFAVYKLQTDANNALTLGESLYDGKDYVTVHAAANGDGIYFSKENSVWYFMPEKSYCYQLVQNVGGQVEILRHIPAVDDSPGRVLAVTDNKLVMIYGDQRKEVDLQQTDLEIVVSKDVAFHLAEMSRDYLVLANRDKSLLSVLRWEDVWKAKSVFSYDSSFEHLSFSVHQSGNSVMLYRINAVPYSIWDKNGETEKREPLKNWENVWAMQYLRSGDLNADFSGECLKALYIDGSAAYYSAEDGRLLDLEPERTDGNEGVEITTKDYIVSYRRNGDVTIQNKRRKVLKTLSEGQLSDATQYQDYLLISFIVNGKEPKTYFLDRNLQELAVIPSVSMVSSEGALYFDDLQGHVIRERLYSLDELREQASQRLDADGERDGEE